MANTPSRHERLIAIVDLASSLDGDSEETYYGLPGQIDQLEKHNEWLHQLQEQTLALIEDNHMCIDALRRLVSGSDEPA